MIGQARYELAQLLRGMLVLASFFAFVSGLLLLVVGSSMWLDPSVPAPVSLFVLCMAVAVFCDGLLLFTGRIWRLWHG